MTGYEIFQQARSGKISWKKAMELSGENLRASGLVQAKPLFNWIEPEWLAKGISMGAIEKRDDEYCFVYRDRIELKVVGEQGRKQVTQETRIKDMSAVTNWFAMYEAYRKEKATGSYQVDLTGMEHAVKSYPYPDF